MFRPLKAAKPATTSAMLARSQLTVMRGSWLCWLTGRAVVLEGKRTCGAGSSSGTCATATARTGLSTGRSASGSAAGVMEDQLRNVRGESKLTFTAPSSRTT